MTKKTNRKGSKPIKWTTKDTEILLSCKNKQEVRELAPALNRSESACIQRWSIQRKYIEEMTKTHSGTVDKAKKTKTKKSKPKTKKSKKQYKPRWTPEEDLYLLCNFYELSVDEAKSEFNRSYGQIASRLEKIIDSDKPEHINMLRKAAGIISERKKAEQKPVKLTRKERRLAKKQAKLQKQLDRMRDKV
jgi:hypothetical protein